MQGQVFLQRGADIFPIHFFQGLSFFHLETTLTFAKLCYVFEKIYFFFSVTIIFQKGHSKLSKNEPENIPSIKIGYL